MIVIGDVHGCFNTLKALIKQFPKGKNLCFVGDLIDRGHFSAQVVDFVKKIVDKGRASIVCGNHEDMAIKSFFGNEKDFYSGMWYKNGAQQTLKSYYGDRYYEIKEMTKVKEDCLWFKSLPYYLEYKNDKFKFIISHSSILPVYEMEECEQRRMDTLWDRNFYFKGLEKLGIFNIFGHTPVKNVEIKDFYSMIDTGAVYGYKLSAIDLDEMKIYEEITHQEDTNYDIKQ